MQTGSRSVEFVKMKKVKIIVTIESITQQKAKALLHPLPQVKWRHYWPGYILTSHWSVPAAMENMRFLDNLR